MPTLIPPARPAAIGVTSLACRLLAAAATTTLASASEPPAPSLAVELADDVRSAFVWIAPGTFTMGSPADEANRDRDEGPPRPVTLTRGFYLARHEVTQAEWLAVLGENPSAFKQDAEALLRPVSSVSWQDCQRFLAALNARGTGRFRLPTEAEWEYAARGGSTAAYPWGGDGSEGAVHARAWANSRSAGMPHPVGTKPPNAWGLMDMAGNVWEWCSDWYGPYPDGPATDPAGPAQGTERVFRGGSWFDFAPALRSANRHRHVPDGRYTAVGLRLVYEPAPGSAAPARPRPPQPESVVALPNGAVMRFVRIPAGEFLIGSGEAETGRARDEGPRQRVRLSREFHLGKFEVTQAQWRAVMGDNPSTFRDHVTSDAAPVDRVFWLDCQEFLARLNRLGRGTFRLPTEAEWEYAARAGTGTRFAWGDDEGYRELRRHAWINGPSEGRSHPVGLKLPNAWGLHDTLGNVWEWCSDWFGPYPAEERVDPAGPATGQARIIRGGSWFNEPEAQRPANRHRHAPDARLTNLGLRVVWEPAP